MRKGGKYLLIVFAGFFLLTAILLLITQTAFFRERVKKKLITVTENQLNLSLDIEKLEGNFFSNIHFQNIHLYQNDSTVALLPSLRIHYNLWDLPGLVISIDSVVIDEPQINMWQKNDSTWNLNSLLKANDITDPKTQKPFNFEIKVSHFAIKNGGVSISSFSSIIPQKTKNINLTVNGSYSESETKIHLQKFNFATENPSLVLKNLSGIYKMNEDGIQVDSLHLLSEGSTIDIKGKYAAIENASSTIDARKIDNKELAIFIPSFKLLCSPALKTTLITKNDSVTAQVELQHNNQSLKANILLRKLDNLLSKKEPVPYFADLNFKNFRLENWIETSNQKALINGNIHINGTNALNLKSEISVLANLKNSQYEDVVFNALTFSGVYNHDNLNAKLDVNSDYGHVEIAGILKNISATPTYQARIKSRNFNLTAFVPEIKGTTLNGIIQAEGMGFDIKNVLGKAEITLSQSSVYEFPFDSLYANVSLSKLNLNIDSLRLEAPGANAYGIGNVNLDSLILKSLIYAHITSLDVIDSLVILPVQFDSLNSVTAISGPIDQLKIEGDVDIYNASGYSVETKKANAKYLVSVKNDSVNVSVTTIASSVITGPASWDTTFVDFNYNDSGVDIDANVIWKDTINASIRTHITIGDTMLFEIPKFEVKTLLSDYFLPDTMQTSIYGNEKIEIENFRIKDYNREDFVLAANGTISTSDTNAFKIELNQFGLQQLNSILNLSDSINGLLKSEISISGTSQNPLVVGSVGIENPQFGKYSVASLLTKFNYINQNGFVEFTTSDLGNSFYASINAPFKAYIDSSKLIYSPPESFNANFIFDSLEVSQFTDRLIYSDSISGIIDGKIEARGDLTNPQFFGKLDFTNGHFADKTIGIDYNKIRSSLVFDGKKVTIDKVLIQQRNGLLSLTGEIEFDSTLIKGNVKSSSLQLDANNFFITQHRNYEILIDANSFVKTDKQHPEFGGKVKVIRSDIYLPALMPENKTNIETDVPLLVQAIQATQDSTASNDSITVLNPKAEHKKSALYDNLTGRLNVEIPRNTWIKNDDMKLELSGDLEIVKTGSYFEIFGNIDVLRGQYILYGKKLNVQESQIIFQGGEELDPRLNIIAEYIYRSSDKEKRYLKLIINGRVSEPEITFLLDDSEITETDGISVLIFGATSDEIGYSGQNKTVGSIGSNAVASIITSQLSKTIGTQLKLDMIEVTSTENWQSAAFVVGKYITNDIFVTYQRGFGEIQDDEITPENITIEYEINDKFFLRLESGSSKTSGIDIILKFEQDKEKIVPATTSKQDKQKEK